MQTLKEYFKQRLHEQLLNETSPNPPMKTSNIKGSVFNMHNPVVSAVRGILGLGRPGSRYSETLPVRKNAAIIQDLRDRVMELPPKERGGNSRDTLPNPDLLDMHFPAHRPKVVARGGTTAPPVVDVERGRNPNEAPSAVASDERVYGPVSRRNRQATFKGR